MEEALIKGTPVCHEVETKNCILFMGNERCFPSFPREVCIDTYEILSMEMPPIRRAARGTDTCNTKVAVCEAKTTTEPKKEKCTASFSMFFIFNFSNIIDEMNALQICFY